jgi:hypothetical protein
MCSPGQLPLVAVLRRFVFPSLLAAMHSGHSPVVRKALQVCVIIDSTETRCYPPYLNTTHSHAHHTHCLIALLSGVCVDV